MRWPVIAALLLFPQDIPSRPIRIGGSARGELAADDPAVRSRHVDAYTFRGGAGSRLVITLESEAFDTFLRLTGPEGFSRENDDVEQGNTNSALQVTLSAAGEYTLHVTSYDEGETGAYTLRVRRARSAASNARSVRLGQTLERTMGASPEQFALAGRAGQQVEIRVESDAFDTLALLEGPDTSITNDDDSEGGTTNSVITATLPEDGEYVITVRPYRAGTGGAYRLILIEAGVAGQVGGPIAPGGSAQGEFSRSDPRRRTGEYCHRYTFDGSKDQRVAITMRSSSVDSYLILQMPNGNQEHNNDYDGENSRIDVMLPADGEYTIIATCGRRGQRGRYVITVDLVGERRPSAEATAPAVPLAAGAPVEDRLMNTDGTLVSGEPFDRYTFTGSRGRTIAIEMDSRFFDPYLIAVGPDGARMENDDATAGEDNARLVWTLPADGEYEVWATCYRVARAGGYEIQLIEDPPAAPEGVAGRIYGVFAGISDYPGNGSDLPLCREDAERMQEALRATGRLDHSTLLVDSNATIANIAAAIRDEGRRARRDDMFIFFYSGHGSQQEGSREESDGIDETIYVYDGNILDDEMARLFNGIDARVSVIGLDSCFAGGFARDVVDRRGRLGFFSSEEDVLSNVAEKFEAGGYLSHFLRAGLEGEADADEDRIVTVDELSRYMHVEWAEAVEQGASSTGEGMTSNQNLVIERGHCKPTDPILRLGR